MRFEKKWISVVCMVLMALFFAVACGFSADRMPRGCFVDGTDVSGMRFRDAETLLRKKAEDSLKEICFTVQAGEREYVFRFPELYYESDLHAVLQAARKRGGAYRIQKKRRLVRQEQVLRGICDDFYRESRDAVIRFDAEKEDPFTIEPQKCGQYIDGAELLKEVERALESGQDRVVAEIKRDEPSFTAEQARASVCLLSSFTTRFSTENEPRCHNIALAAKALSGTILEAGEIFSFNKKTGERTVEKGYRSAPIIEGGKFVSGVGGGVCQVSTTVYNAALLSGMKILEQHPHSLSVGYVEPSFDAMVSGLRCDLRFQNVSCGRVYIRCLVKGGALRVEFYGKASDVIYERKSIVTEVLLPPEPQILEGEADAVVRSEKNGLKSEGYLIIREKGKPERQVRIRKDKYAPVQGIYQRGASAQEDGQQEAGQDEVSRGEKQSA